MGEHQLRWQPRKHGGPGDLVADIGKGMGRYSIRHDKENGRITLFLNGEFVGSFDRLDDAKKRAQMGADLLRTQRTDDETRPQRMNG